MPAPPLPAAAATNLSVEGVEATPPLLTLMEALGRQAARSAWRDGEQQRLAPDQREPSCSHDKPAA